NKAEKESVRQDTEGRNTTNKPPRRRRRPDAIIIQPTDGISYSEVLKLVTRSNDTKLQSVGEQVRRVRKTAGDGLILEMGMNSKPSMLKMKDELSEALGLKAKVRALTQETILEIRDIDCLVSKEDVLVACEKLSQANLELSAIKALRPGFDGMQLAIVSMPKEAASSILQNGKIRIGWTSCRVRERLLQLNLNHCLAAQELLKQTVRELKVDAALLSEPYKRIQSPKYVEDTEGKASIWVCGLEQPQLTEVRSSRGFVRARWGNQAGTGSVIDLAFVSYPIARSAKWAISNVYTASDHRAITIDLDHTESPRANGLQSGKAY
ncbi:hypothetical protein KR215_010211, partial [Drosophila sulfurigaster]